MDISDLRDIVMLTSEWIIICTIDTHLRQGGIVFISVAVPGIQTVYVRISVRSSIKYRAYEDQLEKDPY